MKALRQRMKTVESTMQITKAMELVASSRLRQAKERMERSRPYFALLFKTLNDIIDATADFRSPYLASRQIRRTCYIVIMGDRGLAGGYNNNVVKLIATDAQGRGFCALPIGRKAAEYFERVGADIVSQDFRTAANLSVSDSFEIARIVTQGFLRGDFDEIKIGYTKFISLLSQTAAILPVLPFRKRERSEEDGQESLILYEPAGEEVFDAVIPEYVAGLVYGALSESVACELAARRTAMDSATKNAGEMMESLGLRYNRLRQAAITQEITEIISGSES